MILNLFDWGINIKFRDGKHFIVLNITYIGHVFRAFFGILFFIEASKQLKATFKKNP